MSNDRSVGPGVLCVQTHGGVLEDDQVEGFIEPPGKQDRDLSNHLENKTGTLPRVTFSNADSVH